MNGYEGAVALSSLATALVVGYVITGNPACVSVAAVLLVVGTLWGLLERGNDDGTRLDGGVDPVGYVDVRPDTETSRVVSRSL